jgi:hypothetical protein
MRRMPPPARLSPAQLRLPVAYGGTLFVDNWMVAGQAR